MTDREQTLAELSRQARTDAGFSQQQLADKTRIPLSFIDAIEGGGQVLPDPTYCRGFIRLLCKVLQVDSAPFLEAYRQTIVEQQSAIRSQRNTLYPPEVLKARPLSFNSAKKKSGSSLWLLLMVVVMIIGIFVITRQDDPPNHHPLAVEEDSQPLETPVATSSPLAKKSQTLTLIVEQPVQVATAFDGEHEQRELLLPQTYVFNFNREGRVIVEDTAAVKLWFNGEEIVNLRRGGKRRRLVFRADSSVERTSVRQ